MKGYEATDWSDVKSSLSFHFNNTNNVVITVKRLNYASKRPTNWGSVVFFDDNNIVFAGCTFSILHLFRCCIEDNYSTLHFFENRRINLSMFLQCRDKVLFFGEDGSCIAVMGLPMPKCPGVKAS